MNYYQKAFHKTIACGLALLAVVLVAFVMNSVQARGFHRSASFMMHTPRMSHCCSLPRSPFKPQRPKVIHIKGH